MKERVVLVLAVLYLVCTANVCAAAANDALARENQELRQRVDKLEAQLQEIKALLQKKEAAPEAPAAPLSEAELAKIAAMVNKTPAGKKPVVSGLDVELYGFVRLDGSYDTQQTDPGNFVRWVEPETGNREGDEFNISANATRLGINLRGPEGGDMNASGKVEVDFFGAGLGENKAGLMMRHAYVQLDWPEERFSITGGQTWDVFSPLNPNTLSYSVQWWSGNIGYRRPQLRLTKGFALGNDIDVTLAGAIARTIGDSSFMGTAITANDEDQGGPVLQGRAGFVFPSLSGYKKTSVGVSGHWGEEEYDTTVAAHHGDVETWSFNIDLTQPINEWLTINGEFFTGENLDAFLGGIGQGINAAGKGIRSKGGWVAAALTPWDKWAFNFGVGIDEADRDDLAAGGRTYNRSIFGNVMYSINKNTTVGFELTRWDTRYKNKEDADSLRANMALIYKF